MKDSEMKNLVSRLLCDEDGAVTVDFVVLVAAICLLGFVVVSSISVGLLGLNTDIVNFLGNVEDYLNNGTT